MSSTDQTAPSDWSKGNWGINTSVFSYATTGHTGSRSLKIQTTSYTNGDAKWYFTPQPVISGTTYAFSDYYQSTVATSVVAQFDNGAGAYSYQTLVNQVAPSAGWAQSSANFTIPTGVKNVTIFHLINTVGTLNIDDMSLVISVATPTPTPTPTPTTSLIANPSVETANPLTPTRPQSWLTGSWGTNTSSFTYSSTGAQDGTRSLMIQTTSYTNGDAKWYFNPVAVTAGTTYNFSDYYKSSIATDVIAQLDNGNAAYTYLNLGTATANIASWKQFGVSFTVPAGIKSVIVFHVIAGVGSLQTDNFSLTPVPIVAAPTVALTSPSSGASVSGNNVTITAAASDSNGVENVQFKIDGVNIGNADTTSPYAVIWDSTSVTNGTHSITAAVTNTAGTVVTSSGVSIAVNNIITSNTNLISNSSFEIADPSNANLPFGWQSNKWGTNTTTFSYLATGGHTGNRAVQVSTTKYTSGDAKWYFNPISVTPGTEYRFADYYKSTVNTELDAVFTMKDGSILYQTIGQPSSGSAWNSAAATFTAPTNAVSVTIYHLIYSTGSITIDDASLKTYTEVGFNRALVSLTFDDGWASSYTSGLPLLQKYGFVSTQYIISGYLGAQDYMTIPMIAAFQTQGSEIGSHTVDHPDLTTLSQADLTYELSQSQKTLQSTFGPAVAKDFASPYGAYNQNVLATIAQYYQSHRSTDTGYNSKDSFNAYNILVQNVDITTTPAQVAAWVAQAQVTSTWLVLVYHQVDTSGGEYSVTPANLDTELSNIKASNIVVKTMQQALTEVQSQL